MKLKELENMPTIAYYSGWNGIEIKSIEYGIEDYVHCISGAFRGQKRAHRVKIGYDNCFRVNGHRIPLYECIRTNI